MEKSISHKRTFTNNNGGFITSHRSVYDDVFGCPPNLGPPTLAPRLEDYTEIFNGFHSSRSSSIPMLDVPLMIGDDSEFHFDYAEVFGESKGLDWTPSFHDVVTQSSAAAIAGYYSSDEPWSPAKSGSLSDGLDPLASSDKSYRWSDEDSHRSLQTKSQLNVCYNRSGKKTTETVLAGASLVTKFGEDVQYKESLYNPSESGCYVLENDDNVSEIHCSDTSFMDRPFMTISDISLRTKPCRVPPPSRPPPALAVKKGSKAKLKASKSYAFERVEDTTTPLFFDVEVDGNLYVEGVKDVNMKQACSKGSKKRVDSWDDSICHLEEDMKEEEKVNKTTGSYTSFEGDKLLQTPQKETITTGPVAWREEKEYFEVIEKDISMEPFESVADSNVSMEFRKTETSKSLATAESEASEENEDCVKFKVKASFGRDNKRNQLDMTRDNYDCGSQHRRERTETMSGDKKEFRAKVMPEKLVTINTIVSDHDQRDGESRKPRVDLDETEANLKENVSFKIDQRFTNTQTLQNSYRKPEKYIVRNEYQSRLDNLGHAEIGVRVKQNVTSRKENEHKPEESHMPKEDERTSKDDNEHGQSGNSCSAADRKVGEQISFVGDKDKAMLVEVVADKLNELKFISAFKDLALERGKERNGDALLSEDKYSGVEKAEIGQDMYLRADASVVLPSKDAKETDPNEMTRRPDKWDSESNVPIKGDHSQVDYLQNEAAAKLAENDENPQNLEKGNMELKILLNCCVNESGSRSVDPLVVGEFNNVSKDKDENTCFLTNNKAEGCIRGRPTCIMPDKIASTMGYGHEIDKNIPAKDNQEQTMKRTQVTVEEVETKDGLTPCQVVSGSRVEDALSVSECNKDQQYSSKILLNQSVERKDKNQQHLSKNTSNKNIGRKDKNTKDNPFAKDQKVGDRIRRDIELENEHLRRIEEEREREREREKDRMAVDKAAFEAYERSHVEAREKAERAAVERATTEVRQRAMAVARERLEKTSIEVRQRVERAAVERATAEARQRAVERSKAEKAVYERTINDRFSVPSRSADTKQSFMSSNIQFQDQGLASELRHSSIPADVGAKGESPQRCKARLERYRRTAERAANALAEKNKRDLLAQKEREERNRVAETLDVEVKRWSSGKEGNLRALLSTLQYILGPNSGWQPVPLTEVITSAAVKKAYRKATLCVHPDKLQQRGATIHQKYTCEKVFDLLKEAWNKFNSEER